MASHADHRRITPTGIATAGVLVALMLLALCTWGASAAQAGTLVITKGGDRNVASNSFTGATNYAQNLAGAEFEYSSSAAGPWTTVPGTTGANGQVSTVLSAGIYYVREKTPAPGFTNFGPLQSVSFGNSAQQYTARVEVENTGTTYAHPHTNTSGTPGNWTPTNDASSSNNGSPFLDVRDNGTVPDTCGQNILLVLDRSGSIDDYRQSYEAAAKAFVNQMNGTPTQIGILSFNNDVNSYSPSQGSSSYYQSPLDLSNPGSATTLNSTISNIYDNPSGSTNWDEALQAAAAAKGFTANASTGQTSNPDMVVFITDGNPTTSPIDGGGFGSSTTLQNLSGGIASANLVKNQTSRPGQKLKMLAIGVGSGVTADNLKVVSGPVQGVNGDYAVPTIPELDAFLSELAAKQCGARVYVRKRIAGDNTNQAGWKYTAVDPRPGHTPTYLDNNNATHSSGNPPVVQTGAFFTSLPTGPTTVQVNENAAGQPVSNFSLTSVVCRDDGYDGGQVVPGTQNGLNYSLDVNRGDEVYCTYTNAVNTTLSISKTPDNQTINAGDDAEFTITVTNTGGNTASAALVSDQLPAPGVGGWTVSQQPAGGNCTVNGSNLLGCTLGDIPAGQSRTIKVKTGTDEDHCAVYDNPAAKASASNASEVTDAGKITCQKPSLEVTKTATSGTINAGEDAEFSVTLKNNGPGVAKSPTLSDPLPTGTAGPWTIVSQPAGNPCSITAGTLACAFSDLASGQSQTVTVKAPTSAQACATYSNTATGSAANAPSATGSATINCQKPSLAITKTAAAANVNAGDDIQFTVKVSNAGPGTASNVNVSDPLPGGTQGAWTIVSQPAGDPCSITAGTLNCAFGDLAAGQDRTVVIKAGTSYDACTTYDNTATVTSDNAGTDNASARVICDKSDLGVLKTAVHATISAGDNAEFTIVTSNTGAGTAKDVEMTDQLPTGVSGPWTITNQPAGDPCSISGNTLTCNFGDMSSGASYSVTVSAPTDFDSCTTLDNTATATSTNAPDDSDDASIDCQKPNLSVTKTAENATINAGDTARFTIKVANGGPGVAKGVSLSDPLPAGTDGWVIDSQPAGDPCSIAAGTLSCANLGDLAAGADVTIVISAPTSFQNCATYDNTATASSSNAPDASDGDTITCQKPDLEMEKTGNGPINAGEDAIFTIKLTNNGPGVAKNASLSDPLPAGTGGWTIDPANPDCSITAGTLNCDFGDLAAGTSKTVTVKASTSVEACATWDNTATGSADNSPDATGSASIACQNADVGVLKTAVHATINAGENAEFTIVTSNAGPGVAKDVQMTDPLPAGVSGAWTITDQPAGDPCSITAGTLTCNFGDMASGASYSVTVSAPTDFDSCTTLDNTATATSTNADGDSDQASINCQKPNLSVTKTADNATINAGEDAAFTIRVENAGPGTAKAVTLNDPLPAGTAGPWTIVSQPAGDPCSITAGTLTCDFGDLAADASAEVKISAPTSHEDCTAYDNTATTSSSNAPDASDEARIVCEKPDLATLKTAVQGTISAGDTAEYTIEVSNSGPGVAKGVTLHDPLPAGTSGDWTITDQPAGDPCSITAGTLNCDFGDMAAGVSRSVTVSAPTSFDNCSTLLNKATASGDNAADADGSATINCQKPNLTVQKNGNGTVNAGEDVEFTITVANGGPGVARNVTLSDSVPSGVADAWTISSQPAGDPCSITAGVLDCDFGDMNAETSHTVTIVAPTDFEHCATYDNTATASAGNSPDASDSDTVNCLKPDVGVTKTGSGRTGIGMDLSFTIKVTNNGEGTAKGVVVDDPLSDLAGPWSIDSQSDGAGCQILDGANTLRPAGTVSGPRLFCDIGDLESGESIEVTIRARMNNSVCRPVENIATVTSENAPEATADATVKCIRPRLQLRKKANHRAVLPGQRVRYTILVRNRRLGSVATNLRVCDRIPPKMTVVNQGSGHFANGLLCWKIDRLEGSKQWTRMHYVTRVDQTANGGEHLRNVVTLRKLRAQWTVRVKNPPVRQRRRHHSRVTG